MLRHLMTSLPLIVGAWLLGCRGESESTGGTPDSRPTEPAVAGPASRPATQPTSFTGTLRGHVAAIGGDTTGWRLEGDAQTGGFEVDVSKVRHKADALEGRRVTVTGALTTRGYVERGHVQVLVAESIEEERPPEAR